MSNCSFCKGTEDLFVNQDGQAYCPLCGAKAVDEKKQENVDAQSGSSAAAASELTFLVGTHPVLGADSSIYTDLRSSPMFSQAALEHIFDFLCFSPQRMYRAAWKLYNYGYGSRADLPEAVSLWRRSHALGYLPASFRLAYAYYHGRVVALNRDIPRGREMFVEAAKKGHGGAALIVALDMMKGQISTPVAGIGGWDAVAALAFSTLKKEAEGKNLESQHWLGVCYENGVGTKQDGHMARHWYRIAARQGHLHSMAAMGKMYEEGKLGVGKNLKRADRWYMRAYERGKHDVPFLGDDEDEDDAFAKLPDVDSSEDDEFGDH